MCIQVCVCVYIPTYMYISIYAQVHVFIGCVYMHGLFLHICICGQLCMYLYTRTCSVFQNALPPRETFPRTGSHLPGDAIL